jgi:hypothetical protein
MTNNSDANTPSWLERLNPWSRQRLQHRAMRRLPRWARQTAAFVTRHGLSNISFCSNGEVVVESTSGIRLLYDPMEKRSALQTERGRDHEPQETSALLLVN